ncbi:hypothetical protein BO70DRAFT_322357 [Aspergillus heteromorphus CBS 117.55]|uniref:DUF8004 domain-containing protein n=1 Tax=Aspergillus heteromorphus CBS 117.55 TaxID=1448321 RepID=A0A317V8W9_9EURO|nr:uncharacterized protein BO70DRAFT_322357 [Aspergillus heteromorphus CBS 117.55]PWY69741.1 hypothetical protein BO70DRAFT_322357 [Aspergillus heteromorphus CBS 117.55]
MGPALADSVVPDLIESFKDSPFKAMREQNIHVPILCGANETEELTDTIIDVFGQVFHTHSRLLKAHTNIWKERQHGEYTARHGHYFEARTEKDGGWGIYRRGACYCVEYPPLQEIRIPIAIESFFCLLQALYLRTVPCHDFRGWRRMIALGIRFQAVSRVREYMNKLILPWTITNKHVLRGLADSVDGLLTTLKLSEDIRCSDLYRESFLHLMGKAHFWAHREFHNAEKTLSPSTYAMLIHHVARQRYDLEKADATVKAFLQSLAENKPRCLPIYLVRRLEETVDNVDGINGRNMNFQGYYRHIRDVLSEIHHRMPDGSLRDRCRGILEFIEILTFNGLRYTRDQARGYPVFNIPGEIELPWVVASSSEDVVMTD